MLGRNKSGVYLIKLYFPLRDRTKELKFVTNCNVLEGLPNLEREDYDYIIITKSSKDRLSLGSHLSKHIFYGADGKLLILELLIFLVKIIDLKLMNILGLEKDLIMKV